MAINIDTVYQRVLAIANKEQRGYITPQEFNLFANQVQFDIFEDYFFKLSAVEFGTKNDSEYHDVKKILLEKIAPFENLHQDMSAVSGQTATLPTNVYRLGTVFYNDSTKSIKVEQVDTGEIEFINQVPLAKPSVKHPVYTRKNATQLVLYPSSVSPAYSTSTLNCHFISRPPEVSWNYTEINGAALYNSASSVNFQLHESEENTLVVKILTLAGVTIKDPQLLQVALQKEAQTK
tara:strand:+ start:543 stop:1247 length:705 start_codon:yes stop_codon:yes gene_type:complete